MSDTVRMVSIFRMFTQTKNIYTFKHSFATENYIYNLIFRSQRSLIAQLRCDVLPIAIEIGRYTNKAVQDRLCT